MIMRRCFFLNLFSRDVVMVKKGIIEDISDHSLLSSQLNWVFILDKKTNLEV